MKGNVIILANILTTNIKEKSKKKVLFLDHVLEKWQKNMFFWLKEFKPATFRGRKIPTYFKLCRRMNWNSRMYLQSCPRLDSQKYTCRPVSYANVEQRWSRTMASQGFEELSCPAKDGLPQAISAHRYLTGEPVIANHYFFLWATICPIQTVCLHSRTWKHIAGKDLWKETVLGLTKLNLDWPAKVQHMALYKMKPTDAEECLNEGPTLGFWNLEEKGLRKVWSHRTYGR